MVYSVVFGLVVKSENRCAHALSCQQRRDMDRTYWEDSGDQLLGETVVSQQSGVRLYDGEDRVTHQPPFTAPYSN